MFLEFERMKEIMKKLLVFGLAALSLVTVMGSSVYASSVKETNNTIKIEQLNNKNEEDIKLELSNEQLAELKEGKELTVDGITLTGLNDEDIELELSNEQLAELKEGKELTVNGVTLTGLNDEDVELELSDEQLAELKEGKELTLGGITLIGLDKK